MGVCYRSIDINDGKFWKAPHAAAIFIGPTLEAEDNRRDYGEVRVQAIGNAGDDILSVVYSDQPSDSHHLRFAQPRALGLKVSDEFAVLLCRGHHRQVHQAGNEIAW